ncbi:NUDIX hydrolase [Marinibactrum halimedae]|uniref:ADP-ribose pyrophosphatase n=1 Tax=Marinibactrum halimedae TaxID=1444977 RepID=A0AA37WMK0_9GAMM|nr:NUDIX hydrolase [Marinibactrum halimedae]MCD9460065.1 NUDIX hydrolase [Marinibactrum halimedae]GLS26463.1 ADP-ribose pyrophosphatase [Marinibactrum halimedae]
MNYCSVCGNPVTLAIPQGDDRERHICNHCDTIHYQNPRIITGCLVTHDKQILLCKRAIEPRKHFWTLPAGFMENGETTEEGAIRETWEEAKATVKSEGLYQIFNLPHINQVYFFYRASFLNPQSSTPLFAAGPESLEVELFSPENLPWDQLAFPVIKQTLLDYLGDREQGHFPVRDQKININALLQQNTNAQN